MLFARAMSNGVRWFCPDVAMTPLYTPAELSAQVDGESGEVIEAEPVAREERQAGGKRLDACALAELRGLAEGLELK